MERCQVERHLGPDRGDGILREEMDSPWIGDTSRIDEEFYRVN
jgi:hypothetical protein